MKILSRKIGTYEINGKTFELFVIREGLFKKSYYIKVDNISEHELFNDITTAKIWMTWYANGRLNF